MEEIKETLDLSRRGLKKIEKASAEETHGIISLILDQNELQRLDNIDSYGRVENLSICNNFLLRMHGVSRLTNVRVLALNNNGILQIEGLKDLIYLKVLKLAGNSIKSIEHLNHNIHLEQLDLSNNQISFIADISYLKGLKHLNLERNRILDLRQCERYLPANMESLLLAHNNIQDLNEVSHLVHLSRLEGFSIQGNPCVAMAGKDKLGFDYRPFVLNWIMSVKAIDGFVVSAIESLKAEWLYSQGKGRHFHAGQHQELCEYLASTCPLTADALETEDQRKLRLILSKAQHHQQQLKEHQNHSPLKSKIQSPRMQSRMSARHMGRSPDRLSSSYHPALSKNSSPSHQMSMSCSGDLPTSIPSGIPTSLPSGIPTSIPSGIPTSIPSGIPTSIPSGIPTSIPSGIPTSLTSGIPTCIPNVPSSIPVMNRSFDSPGLVEKETKITEPPKPTNQALEAASKMVPVPESLMSPDYQDPIYDIQRSLPRPTTNSSPSSTGSHEDKPKKNKSPRLPKSATSSPKLKSKMERKGSLTNAKEPINGVKDQVESDKLEVIKLASNQRRQKKLSVEATAAVTIQKMWRGYRSRNLNKDTLRILHAIQAARARQHIQRLTCDMEATKAALESERKIQQLQMQAINALWKKVSTLQASDSHKKSSESDDNADVLRQLAETCCSLQAQVVELQDNVRQVLRYVCARHRGEPAATQTDITAVEDDRAWLRRPQTLSLAGSSAPEPASTPQEPRAEPDPNEMSSEDFGIARTESLIEEPTEGNNETERDVIVD